MGAKITGYMLSYATRNKQRAAHNMAFSLSILENSISSQIAVKDLGLKTVPKGQLLALSGRFKHHVSGGGLSS